MTSFLKTIADSTGLFADDSPDGWSRHPDVRRWPASPPPWPLRIMLTVYFRSGYRSVRDIARHGLAAAVVLGLLAFVAYDMRHAALAYLGMNPVKTRGRV